MTEAAATRYEREIRDYLLGRLSEQRSAGPISPRGGELPTPPILSWWIFEGRRYRGFDDCLAYEFDRVFRQAMRLRGSHNPRWRYVWAPEGEVDWVATACASVTSGRPEFVCRASRLGLSDEEMAALVGWMAWLGGMWRRYASELRPPPGAPAAVPWHFEAVTPSSFVLRRWAHVAKRSRWPLLRNVVAESLRCCFEPQMLDALPLPSDHPRLFELACIVRILRAINPMPCELRWLARGENTIAIPQAAVEYQLTLDTEAVLAGRAFDSAAVAGIRRYGVKVPNVVDALVRLRAGDGRFSTILLEAKSGDQEPRSALYQLLCYREALREHLVGPVLVLGVTEKPTVTQGGVRDSVLAEYDDSWHFLGIDQLERAVELALTGESLSG